MVLFRRALNPLTRKALVRPTTDDDLFQLNEKRPRKAIMMKGIMVFIMIGAVFSFQHFRTFLNRLLVGQEQPYAVSPSTLVIELSEKAHVLVCQGDTLNRPEWQSLCNSDFVRKIAQNLLMGKDVNVIQIGAHVGFEENDPLAKGLTKTLNATVWVADEGKDCASDKTCKGKDLRKHFHWTFVEPSPPNFKRLEENLANNLDICDMHGINAGVVPDSVKNPGQMTFYSIRDTVDPTTGYDSLTGIHLPSMLTQLSTFDKSVLEKKADMFYNRPRYRHFNLKFFDFFVEIPVDVRTFSDMMRVALQEVEVGNSSKNKEGMKADLVLIDTEGFDCKIINGISPSSTNVPDFVIFEWFNCGGQEATSEAEKHLSEMGYEIFHHHENTVAIKK